MKAILEQLNGIIAESETRLAEIAKDQKDLAVQKAKVKIEADDLKGVATKLKEREKGLIPTEKIAEIKAQAETLLAQAKETKNAMDTESEQMALGFKNQQASLAKEKEAIAIEKNALNKRKSDLELKEAKLNADRAVMEKKLLEKITKELKG